MPPETGPAGDGEFFPYRIAFQQKEPAEDRDEPDDGRWIQRLLENEPSGDRCEYRSGIRDQVDFDRSQAVEQIEVDEVTDCTGEDREIEEIGRASCRERVLRLV